MSELRWPPRRLSAAAVDTAHASASFAGTGTVEGDLAAIDAALGGLGTRLDTVEGAAAALGTRLDALAALLPAGASVQADAAGTTAAEATPLTAWFTEIHGGGGGVRLPAGPPGRLLFITNRTQAPVDLWPAAGMAIAPRALDTAVPLAPGALVLLLCLDATGWLMVPLTPG